MSTHDLESGAETSRTLSNRSRVSALIAGPAAVAAAMMAPMTKSAASGRSGGVTTQDFAAPRYGSTIRIEDAAPASPYGTAINVQGLKGRVSDVNVILENVTHGRPSDIAVMLVHKGRAATIMRNASNGTRITNTNIILDSNSSRDLPPPSDDPDTGPIVGNRSYAPQDYTDGEPFGGTAPTPNDTEFEYLDFFTNLDPNGDWVLYVRDDVADISGPIGGSIGGWSLQITTDNTEPYIDIFSFTARPEKRLVVRKERGLLRYVNNPAAQGLTVEVVEGQEPSKGKLTLREDGSFTYEPRKGKRGKDEFQYQIIAADGSSIEDSGLVRINIKPRRQRR